MENSLNDILIIIFFIRYLNQTFTNAGQTKKLTKNALNLYNKIRLHLYLDFKTEYGL